SVALHALRILIIFFFFNAPAPTALYTLSLHDALPICPGENGSPLMLHVFTVPMKGGPFAHDPDPESVRDLWTPWRVHGPPFMGTDRKSTRLNSSHVANSYAVFCLKKKKKKRSFDPLSK